MDRGIMPGRNAPGRKLLKRACDACKVRKIKCSELPPCDGCTAAGVPCTFKKVPSVRGPRTLRPKTLKQISQRQGHLDNENDHPAPRCSSPDASSTLSSQHSDTILAQDPVSPSNPRTSTASLVLRLCIYRLRLFPIWPIVAVEEIVASLQSDNGNMGTFALANAVGAATMAQLKLDSPSDAVTASSLETQCQRARTFDQDGRHASLSTLRVAFFLHVYHENQDAGGVQSLLYLREALTLAQIMGLHRESTYAPLSSSEQEIRRRIIWLLFVTERGVAMLHNLPVVLKCNAHFPSTECDDGSHILPAFRKLVDLFWIFDQSGAFEMLQNPDTDGFNTGTNQPYQSSLDILQQRLQNVPIDWESSNDVQRADVCVTRQWMRAVLWRISKFRSFSGDQITSLAQPIQIANEFLAVINKLPKTAIEAHGPSIEFKVYEIGSAVADAIASTLRGWTMSNNARDILNQLHRMLASCRGGNMTLASMLQTKIAQLHEHQALLLEPSVRIEDISEQWLDPMHVSPEFDIEFDDSPKLLSALKTSGMSQKDSEDALRAQGRGVEEFDTFYEPQPLGQRCLGNPTFGQESTTLENSSSLHEQLQIFDVSVNTFHLFDFLEPFLSSDFMPKSTGDELIDISGLDPNLSL